MEPSLTIAHCFIDLSLNVKVCSDERAVVVIEIRIVLTACPNVWRGIALVRLAAVDRS